MIKTRSKKLKSNKNANLNHKQDNEPAKLAFDLAELAEEPAGLKSYREKAKPAASQGEETPSSLKHMAGLEIILEELRDFRQENTE